jgi:hypothetical protein
MTRHAIPCPRRQGRRGVAAVALMVVLIVINLAIVGFVLTGARHQDGTVRMLEGLRAFYAAEAGMNMAIRELRLDADHDGDGTVGSISDDGSDASDPTVGGGRVYADISGAGPYTITAYGRDSLARRQLRASLIDATTTSTYTYANRTQGGDIFAYDGESATKVPAVSTTPATVLSAAEYDAIETNNGTMHTYDAPSSNYYAQMRFVIVVDELESQVTQIDVSWNGKGVNAHATQVDGAELHIWNGTFASYTQVGVSADTETEVTLAATITTSLTAYLNGASDDTITLLAVSRDKRKNPASSNVLHTDYLEVTITADAAPLIAGCTEVKPGS